MARGDHMTFKSGCSTLAVLLLTTAAQAGDTTARGVIRAVTEATIAVDYAARIARLPKLEGESFAKGEVLISFDCRRYTAEVAAAKAQARARELVVTNNRKLLAKGAIGGNEVKISEAGLEEARANVLALQARTGACEFKAPFDGRVVERLVHEQESPAPNQPLIRIVDMTRLEVEAIIPSKWLAFVRAGDTFTFAIDETGETLSADVVRMGATVDAVSQTIKAYGILNDPGNSVLPGMSGTATFRLVGS